jgi:hypothetical protein
MPTLNSETNRRSPGQVIADWWHDWRHGAARSLELNDCSDFDTDRMARDLGLTASELQRVVHRGRRAADLLLCRMAALDLNPQEVDQIDRATFLDLERVCTNCDCKGRCKRDLARRADDAVWENYCPNVATLKMLNAMPWASRREW